MEVKLIVLDGKHKDREIPLPETIFMIGRDRQCHLRPHCSQVSKLHCAVAAWAGKVKVRDLKSRNGTFLNGQPIDGEVMVSDGDRLQVGTLVFAFRITNEEGAPLTMPIEKRDVQWLLDSPADSPALSSSLQTGELPSISEILKDVAHKHATTEAAMSDSTLKRRGKAVSAGQHLHDYFDQRKRRPASAAGKRPGPN